MKIIIDIPEEEYNTGQLVHYFGCYSDKLDLVIYNGTPLPEQQHIDKSAMMYEIYMEGVNMTGEYQGCWVRFKNIENIVDKYIPEPYKEGDKNDDRTGKA